jgi:hypothetical protein
MGKTWELAVVFPNRAPFVIDFINVDFKILIVLAT